MSKLTITQAAKVCGYDRSYFYKVIKQYGITINKDHANKSYIDVSELVRVIPAHSLNLVLLEEYTGQQLTTLSHKKQHEKQHKQHQMTQSLKALSESLAIC